MTDLLDSCYKCRLTLTDTGKHKLIKCNTCNKNIHMKCNKTTGKKIEYFTNNPEEFDCRSCLTCKICQKIVASNHRGILCDLCNNWVHAKCNQFEKSDFSKFQADENLQFFCSPCLRDNLPTLGLNDNEFYLTMEGVNYPEEIDITNDIFLTEKQLALTRKINDAIKNGIDYDSEDDDECSDSIDCKYYTIDSFNKQKFNSDKYFTLLHLNIHSLEFHIDELRPTIQLLNTPFDFICLSESKIRVGKQPKVDISIDGYQDPVGTPTEASKGGVLIYVKTGIDFHQRNDLKIYKSKELESVFVEIVNPKGKNTIVGNVYRHPCMDQNLFLNDFMSPLCDKLTAENKQIYLAGDFNFDLSNTSHSKSQLFFETMMSNFLRPSITLPTKINTIHHTIIDNIFTNDINTGIKSGNLCVSISDHLPSFLLVPRGHQYHFPKQNIYKRDTKNFDQAEFILDYFDVNWDEVLQLNKNDVNLSLSSLLGKLNEILDKHMPLKKVNKSELKRIVKPWVTDEIIRKIKLKSKTYEKYVKCKKIQGNLRNILFTEYKSLKNEINSLLRESKKEFYNRYFTRNKKDLRKTWMGIKEIINLKSSKASTPSFVKDANSIHNDDITIANCFNNYFTSIADKILKDRKYLGSKTHRDYLKNPLPNSFVIRECDRLEVENLISSIDKRKSTGPNSIPTDILIMLKSDISIHLSKIFNLSLLSGVYPDKLKISKTIPIFKKGDSYKVSNYRPISLLSNINKLLEKIMFNRTYDFLDKYKCIYKLQFGFRNKHSTDHALVKITESIRAALDNDKTACGIFIDLQKAFDTVNHSILTDKLSHYGIRGTANNWFKSYLNNRYQFVSINGTESQPIPILHGVPQGSVLGPLLFLVYINDLHCAINYSSVYHFADDTNLLNISDSIKRTQKQVNLDLKSLYKWLLANKISLNCSKTELVIFHKIGYKINFNLKIKLNGHKLFPSDSIKYLGVYLDSTLSGKAHRKVLATKLRRANGLLSKIRHYVPKRELISLYHSLFSSHLTYGLQIWGQQLNCEAEIAKIQKRALRIINFEDFRAASNPLFKSNAILKVNDTVKMKNIIFIYDYVNKRLPSCFQDDYSKLNDTYNSVRTRNSNLGCLFIPRRKSTRYGLHSISHKSIFNWNEFTKKFNCNLALLSKIELKKRLEKYFLQLY